MFKHKHHWNGHLWERMNPILTKYVSYYHLLILIMLVSLCWEPLYNLIYSKDNLRIKKGSYDNSKAAQFGLSFILCTKGQASHYRGRFRHGSSCVYQTSCLAHAKIQMTKYGKSYKYTFSITEVSVFGCVVSGVGDSCTLQRNVTSTPTKHSNWYK